MKSLFAQQIQYPPIPGALPPTTFSQLAKYLFNFGIIISGIVALGVLVWAGILYLTSAGDPKKIERAKSKAFGAFLGLTILLSSYLILTAIHPQLALIELGQIEKAPAKEEELPGIYLFDGPNCSLQNLPKPFYSERSIPDLSKLPSPFNVLKEELKSLKIVGKGKKYFAILFTKEAFLGNCYYKSESGCLPVNEKIGSIFLGEEISAGNVFLYEKADCKGCSYEAKAVDWISFKEEEFSCEDKRPTKKVAKNIVSLSLVDEASLVILASEPEGKGDCIFLTKKDVNTSVSYCINLKGGKGFEVYDPDKDYFVQSLKAIKYQEIKK